MRGRESGVSGFNGGGFALEMKTFRRSPVVEISLMPYTYYVDDWGLRETSHLSRRLRKGRAKGAEWIPVAVRNPSLYDSFRIVIPTYGASM